MVAERYLASAYQRFPTPTRGSSSTMANPYPRGAQIVTGGSFVRSASAGAVLVGMAGDVKLNAINRAGVWCQQRQGRQRPNTPSQQMSPMLPIHSHLSDSQTEQNKWNEKHDNLQTEYRRLQDILQEQIDSAGK